MTWLLTLSLCIASVTLFPGCSQIDDEAILGPLPSGSMDSEVSDYTVSLRLARSMAHFLTDKRVVEVKPIVGGYADTLLYVVSFDSYRYNKVIYYNIRKL